MKKIILFLITLCYISSHNAQSNNGSAEKNGVNFFENSTFLFKYPKTWRKTKRFISNRKPIIRISHESVPQQKTFKIHFFVDTITTDFKSLEEFLEDRKLKFDSYNKKDKRAIRTMNTSRVNDNHFVESLKIEGLKNPRSILTQSHLIHYHFYEGQIYSLTYSATPNYFDKFLSDVIYMLDNFKFKNQRTDLELDPKPEKQPLLKEQ